MITLADLTPELRTLRGTLITGMPDEAFFELWAANPELRLERTAQRDILLRFLVDADTSEVKSECQAQLWYWNKQVQLGHVYGSSAGFRLPDTSVRSPDAAWLSQAKWEQLTPDQRRKFPPVCPEFMLEVKSPSDDIKMLQAKMEDYLANGMQLGFLLDVAAETAYIYRPGQPAKTVQDYDQELSGEPVLPGFWLDLRPLRRAA